MWSKSGLKSTKRAVALRLEQLWSLGFLVAGSFHPRDIPRWSSSGGARVLIVAPHPDDEAAGCVGTLCKHLEVGDEVLLAVVTDGRQSKVIPDPHQMSLQRRTEAHHAAHLLGIHRLEWMGLAEGDWPVLTLVEKLATLIHAYSPTIIYAPSRIDFHPEHRLVAHALALALARTAQGARVVQQLRIYPIQVPLNAVVINLITDVSNYCTQSDAVMEAYASQAGSLRRCNRLRRYSGKRYGIQGRAEVFWQVSARAYVTLHREHPEGWSHAFRGLRDFPITDPLAYLRGLHEQSRLLRKAAG